MKKKILSTFAFLLVCALSMTSCVQPSLSESPASPEPENQKSAVIEKAEIIPEPLGQTIALHAYDQIMTSLGALLPHESDFPNYPAEFADAYYQDGFLFVCLTEISPEMQEKYIAMVDTPQVLQFKQVTYSYNDLFTLLQAIRPTEDIILSSWGIDVKENCVSIGIPDITKEAETLAQLIESFPQEIKAHFTEYPIVFQEEGFAQPA